MTSKAYEYLATWVAISIVILIIAALGGCSGAGSERAAKEIEKQQAMIDQMVRWVDGLKRGSR